MPPCAATSALAVPTTSCTSGFNTTTYCPGTSCARPPARSARGPPGATGVAPSRHAETRNAAARGAGVHLVIGILRGIGGGGRQCVAGSWADGGGRRQGGGGGA